MSLPLIIIIIHHHTRHPLDMASDQRHVQGTQHSSPLSNPSLLFLAFLFCSSMVTMSSSRVASFAGHCIPHERAMMDSQNLSAGDGMDWCGKGRLDYGRLCFPLDSDTTVSSSSSHGALRLARLHFLLRPSPFRVPAWLVHRLHPNRA